MILVYITCKDMKEAEKVSRHLLNKKLIACANIFPIKSLYHWKGKFCDTKEAVIIAKSVEKLFFQIKKEVKKVHSYSVPEIIALPIIAGNEDYLEWINVEIND